MGTILADRVSRLGQFRFLALGIIGAFFIGPVLASIWPPTPDPTIADSPNLAAGMLTLWLFNLIIPLWVVLFYIRTFFFFIPRGEVRLVPARPKPMRRSELERDADLRALGFAGLGQFEARIVGRAWGRYMAYVNADGSVTATSGRSRYRSIICFSTYWTNGFYLCGFHGLRRLAGTPASAEKRVLLLRGTLREAYQQFSAEVARIEFPAPASVVGTTNLGQAMAHELDDSKSLPSTAALLRRSRQSMILGVAAAMILVFGLFQTVALFPWA